MGKFGGKKWTHTHDTPHKKDSTEYSCGFFQIEEIVKQKMMIMMMTRYICVCVCGFDQSINRKLIDDKNKVMIIFDTEIMNCP